MSRHRSEDRAPSRTIIVRSRSAVQRGSTADTHDSGPTIGGRTAHSASALCCCRFDSVLGLCVAGSGWPGCCCDDARLCLLEECGELFELAHCESAEVKLPDG